MYKYEITIIAKMRMMNVWMMKQIYEINKRQVTYMQACEGLETAVFHKSYFFMILIKISKIRDM